MEKFEIKKERIWVFAPVNNVVMHVKFERKIEKDYMLEKIVETLASYQNFRMHVEMEGDKAYWIQGDPYPISFVQTDKSLAQIVKEQERIPFDIWKGELIRFFYQEGEKTELIVISHHILGDGISMTFLLRELQRALGGQRLSYKEMENLACFPMPKESELKGILARMLKYYNNKWKKTGKVFTMQERSKLCEDYWASHETYIQRAVIEGEEYDKLIQYGKENGVKINSLLAAAFARALHEKTVVGMAVNLRENDCVAIGNMASGISADAKYKESKTLAENAKLIEKRVYAKLNRPVNKYFLAQFLNGLEPTLNDAIYFAACAGYENKTARSFAKMFGYMDNPSGISLTNLTTISKGETYQWEEFDFLPPLVLNGKRIIGAVSLPGRMSLMLHVAKDDEIEEMITFFKNAVGYLKSL